MSDTAITVLVVDGHQTFAELLGVALRGQPALRYVGHARTGQEALRLVGDLRPDVVLLDPELSDSDGIAIAELMKHRYPDTRVVILTASNEAALVGRATAAGAAGFLTKNGPLGDVLNAVHTAHGGGMTVSTDILARLLRSTAPVAGPRPGGLTAREHEVLELMAAGLDPRAIARRLGISVHTCRGHVKALLGKLGAHSQLEAVGWHGSGDSSSRGSSRIDRAEKLASHLRFMTESNSSLHSSAAAPDPYHSVKRLSMGSVGAKRGGRTARGTNNSRRVRCGGGGSSVDVWGALGESGQ